MKISVIAKTGKKNNQILKSENGELVVSVKNRPIDGKANEEIIETIAKYFDKRKSSIKILSGHKSKKKIFEIL